MPKKRGRKTAAQLEAVEAVRVRPEPPDDLNEREEAIWREVVSELPADWFRPETLRLLKAYCSHMDRFERLSYMLDQQMEKMDVNDIAKMGKAAEVESRAAMSLATKMRITQQATYDREKHKSTGPKKPAWANIANQ